MVKSSSTCKKRREINDNERERAEINRSGLARHMRKSVLEMSADSISQCGEKALSEKGFAATQRLKGIHTNVTPLCIDNAFWVPNKIS
ncbi:hypothetical protein LSTR_LSTR003288 [Laodelphax striatellus]|uniref:Uncharacterized protein n=1 Tax=Laodelphax striatellus TaxID=195883 RepID=A0A482XU35_LAOST|nr:hypothetical protein LSTR_LSTR003288 [Laodelphax striatellus]